MQNTMAGQAARSITEPAYPTSRKWIYHLECISLPQAAQTKVIIRKRRRMYRPEVRLRMSLAVFIVWAPSTKTPEGNHPTLEK